MSLRAKLTLSASLVTLLALALLAVGSGAVLARVSWSDLDRDLRLQGQLVLKAARENGELLPFVASSLRLESGVAAALAYRDGRALWVGGNEVSPRPLDPAALRAHAAGDGPPDGTFVTCACGEWRVASVSSGAYHVQVARPTAPVRETLNAYARGAVLVGAGAALLAGLVTWLAVSSAISPLERLARRVRHLDSPEPVPGVERHDEVGALARALDRSLDALRVTRQREARFLADASHELRHPVTALVTDLEHTLSRPRELPEARAALGRSYRVALHLRDLTQNLLALTRSRAARPARVPLDLLALASDVADLLVPLAAAKDLELEVYGEPAWVRGDPVLLTRAVENLVQNAIKFTDEGFVRVDVRPGGARVRLDVTDSGPGLPDGPVAPLFEPFAQAAFPANGTRREGAGLGLAVVKSVVDAHGGQVWLTTLPEGGTRVWVELPAEPPGPGAR